MLHTRELSNAELFSNYVSIDNEPPNITATTMELDNSKVNVIFSDHMSSTLQPSDFSLSLNGGSATLASQTPTSVTVSGTKVSLGVNLIGTPMVMSLLLFLFNLILFMIMQTMLHLARSQTIQLTLFEVLFMTM